MHHGLRLWPNEDFLRCHPALFYFTHITSKSPRFPNVSFWSVFELVPMVLGGSYQLMSGSYIQVGKVGLRVRPATTGVNYPPSTVTVVHHEVSFDLNLSFNSFPFRSLLDAALDLSTLRCSPLTRSFSTACLRRLLWKPEGRFRRELATNEAAASCVKVYSQSRMSTCDHVCHTAFQGLRYIQSGTILWAHLRSFSWCILWCHQTSMASLGDFPPLICFTAIPIWQRFCAI